MKTLIIITALLMGNVSVADVRECTDTLNVITDLTYNYIETMKGCKELEDRGEASSRGYEGYRRIARDTERVHSQAQAHCRKVCDDTFFCDGDALSGACTK